MVEPRPTDDHQSDFRQPARFRYIYFDLGDVFVVYAGGIKPVGPISRLWRQLRIWERVRPTASFMNPPSTPSGTEWSSSGKVSWRLEPPTTNLTLAAPKKMPSSLEKGPFSVIIQPLGSDSWIRPKTTRA